MEDLAVVLKTRLQELYKKKTDNYSVEDRKDTMKELRKNLRHDLICEKRKIPVEMSPVDSPIKVEKTVKKSDKNPNKRLEMLLKWKAEKEKMKQEQKEKMKPVFKVTHVPVNVGLPDLENVNKKIKGKPFKSSFAPANHTFHPPPNVTAMKFNNKQKEDNKKEKMKREIPQVTRMVTRSQTKNVDKNENKTLKKTQTKDENTSKSNKKQSANKKKKETKPKQTSNEDSEDNKIELAESVSPVSPIETKTTPKAVKTPDHTEPPIYLSPFVTIARGKNSARKEYSARKLGKSPQTKPDAPDYSSPKAGAAYFTWILDKQISRLQGLCDEWNQYKIEENPPEEAVSMIDVAIGQTNLLITKKFEQFRGLIEKCRNNDCVTCEDLHGFWDMIYLQVNNLDKRFDNLVNLKNNNWEEILPVVKKVVKKKGKTAKSAKASAGLKEAILAARKKKQTENQNDENWEVTELLKKTPQNRKSYLKNSNRNSSPGLMMMKVAQYAKEVETPGRSILKNEAKSERSQVKMVLFKDETNGESDLNKSNIQLKAKTPMRRSSRLSRVNLFT